jgi:FKBP-type peptidyl-prolyl cis-trans isomerase
MHARLALSSFALIAAVACAHQVAPPGGAEPVPTANGFTPADPGVLYAIGDSLGDQLKPYELDADEAEEVARGLLDHALGRAYTGTRYEALSDRVAAFHELRSQEVARREELAGAAALERALSEPGAVKTESGMILNVLDPGSGTPPTIFDYVTVAFEGRLRDGTVFDTSRGKAPTVAQLGTTNRCWQESLGSVGVGARLRVACPPSLGYGWGGWPGVVPGGGVLIYELELIRIEPGVVPNGYDHDGSLIRPGQS